MGGFAAILADCGRRDRTASPTDTSPSTDRVWQAASANGDSGSPVFGSRSVFVQRVENAPLAPNSAAVARTFADAVAKRAAGFNFDEWGVAYYTVGANAPKVNVAFGDCFGSGINPKQFVQAMTQVPIPNGAEPALGRDRHLAIYDPSSHTLWEMWRASADASGRWSACWGGRIQNTDTAPGYFSDGTGASATGIALSGVMVTIDEVRRGRIRHAVGVTHPSPAKGRFSFPAQRTDGGSDSPDAPLEGQRFRLDPTLNVDALQLTPIAAMVARAAQEYGLILVDRSDAVGIVAESSLPSKLQSGSDPWSPLLGLSHIDQYDLLKGFPWDRLQAIQVDWGRV